MDTDSRCPCGGNYERRRVEVRMTPAGRLVVFDRVPQLACPVCGSRVYQLSVLNALECALRGVRQMVNESR